MNGYALYSQATATPKTVEQWQEFIAGGRSKTARTCDNNTTARLEGGGIAIRLHNTDVVTLLPNGNAVLNSGGWLTVTTKQRINTYSRAGISQKAGIWYMQDGSLFYDGIIIDRNGKPLKPKQPQKYEQQLTKIKKEARAYAKNYVDALKNGLIDYPNGGDCWFCLFKDKDGKGMTGTDHIRQHIKDKYYVPSLLVNAGRSAGYKDFQIGLMGIGGQRLFIDPENNIYKYIVKQLQAEL